MPEPSSRYYSTETAEYITPDGRKISYYRRRFLPQGRLQPLLATVKIREGDRLDVLAAKTLGDPEQFWRICDANDAMNPFQLLSEPGKKIRVCQPQFEEPR
ncbi:MAG TPA: hypothetical protein PLZ44_01605 [Methanothrix sp.]|nr:hypothetical protein [Methanothrix sp.]